MEKVTMRFPNAYAEEIMDRFGNTAEITLHGETHFDICAEVFINPIFLGWCAGYGSVLEIVSPQSVKDELVKLMKDALSIYETVQ